MTTGFLRDLHIFGAFAIFGMGVLLGLDTLVSQAYGARNIRECHRLFFDGLSLAALMALPITALLVIVWFAIPSLGFHDAVRPLLESYFGIIILSTPFLLAYATCRRYLQGMHAVTPVMFALVTASGPVLTNTEFLDTEADIWSSALREIHQQLGRTVTDTIVIESLFDVPPSPTFAVMALLTLAVVPLSIPLRARLARFLDQRPQGDQPRPLPLRLGDEQGEHPVALFRHHPSPLSSPPSKGSLPRTPASPSSPRGRGSPPPSPAPRAAPGPRPGR